MNDIASNPVRKGRLGSMLQARREQRMARQAERDKIVGKVVAKQLEKESKVKEQPSKEPRPLLYSQIRKDFNDVSGVYQEITQEVVELDQWAKTIQRMNIPDRNKAILMRTQILWSQKNPDKTTVGLGCQEGDDKFLLAGKKDIERGMSEVSKRTIEIAIIPIETLDNAPQRLEQSIFVRRQAEAKNALEMDEKLQMLVDAFDGKIEECLPMPYNEVTK